MDRRFYATATVALLLAATYNGAAKRSGEPVASAPAHAADSAPDQQDPTSVTARRMPTAPHATRPRS